MHRVRKLLMLWLPLAIITLVLLPASAPAEAAYSLYPSSVFLQPIPAGANYVLEPRISTFRHGSEAYAAPVYRVAAGTALPNVIVTNIYGRVENWPIPTGAQPATGSDGHMVIINYDSGFVYEFFQAQWTSGSTIEASSMVAYPINGNGISNPARYRVTASGVANTNGMIMRDDFDNGGGLDPNLPILHALSIHLPSSMIAPGGFVAPAVGGEAAGTDRSENRVPMGAHFAIPAGVDVNSLAVHPLTRAILRAARDYGMYVTDASGAGTYNGGNIGRLEIEPGLLQAMFGVSGDSLMDQVMQEIGAVVAQYGVHRIDGFGPGGELTTPTCPEMEDPSFTASQGLYCVVLMRNGAWVNTIGSIPDELVNAGVILAVEVVYYDAPGHTTNDFLNSDYEYVCLAGDGRYIYLDGRQTPRVILEMEATHDHGYTCAWIPAPGTVVLIERE
ncbi:MAG: hypothetical protein U0694_16405 [Anaerolineae bacterium]